MTTTQAEQSVAPKFDNHGQYSRTGILRYEMIFGADYVSTGGPATTDDLCSRLGTSLRSGVRVLDVGSGIGGAAFHLATKYGAHVTGIDLADEMVAIALDRAATRQLGDQVKFILGDVLLTSFAEPFDIIWSRDALMHVPDKRALFARLYSLLAPGGKIVITDYARGQKPGSPEFERYIESTGYHVVEPRAYGRLLEDAGFVSVQVDDATTQFIEILQRESDRLESHRPEFLAAFSADDLKYLVDRWAMKVRFCKAGDMRWGIYLASKAS
jgi:phosphoethanolamine N-methyltransferase